MIAVRLRVWAPVIIILGLLTYQIHLQRQISHLTESAENVIGHIPSLNPFRDTSILEFDDHTLTLTPAQSSDTSLTPKVEFLRALEATLPDPRPWGPNGHEILTQQGIRRLLTCMAYYDDCAERPEGHAIILAHDHFRMPYRGATSGEAIWGEAVIAALQRLGYTPLWAVTNDEVLHLYRTFPDLIRIIIMRVRDGRDPTHNEVLSCFSDEKCILSRDNPTGIPPWKLFSVAFWGLGGDDPRFLHPYGKSRVFVPYEYPDHLHLGYALDHHCNNTPIVEPEKRGKQAFILSKLIEYFYDKRRAFPPEVWQEVATRSQLQLFSVGLDPKNQFKLPEGVIGTGQLTRNEFYEKLTSSVAVIGNMNPVLSPSPLEALCLGVPFIHPYDASRGEPVWSPTNAKDAFNTGIYQHGGLLKYGPPYVYHVPKGNVTALVEALQAAQDTPIHGRGLPEDYQMTTLMKRIERLMATDWKTKAIEEGLLNVTTLPGGASGRATLVELHDL